MEKPKIFISSTIYDFKDLRSALHYHLKEMGYEVLASEKNDFPVNRYTDSYSACLASIKQCQFFILFIGERVGGLYDGNISITQKEYQYAYELSRNGDLKIIPFIRSSVWDHRERVKELAKYLKSQHMASEEIEKIINSPSRFAHDAKRIISFIDEVTHAHEMRESVKSRTQKPINNWVHIFSDFEDVMLCLRQELKLGNIEEKILIENLKNEIYDNLDTLCLEKKDGKISYIFPKATYLGWKEELIRVDIPSVGHEYLSISPYEIYKVYWIASSKPDLKITAIEYAIQKGVWYKHNHESIEEMPFRSILKKLLYAYKRLREGAPSESLNDYLHEIFKSKKELISYQNVSHFAPQLEFYYFAIEYSRIILAFIEGGITGISLQRIEELEEDFRFWDESRKEAKEKKPSREDFKHWVHEWAKGNS